MVYPRILRPRGEGALLVHLTSMKLLSCSDRLGAGKLYNHVHGDPNPRRAMSISET